MKDKNENTELEYLTKDEYKKLAREYQLQIEADMRKTKFKFFGLGSLFGASAAWLLASALGSGYDEEYEYVYEEDSSDD